MGYLGGAQLHATVEVAEDLLMLLKAPCLGSSHAEAGRTRGGPSEAGGLDGGGGGGGGEVGGGGALHLLHAIVPTVVMVDFQSRDSACLHLYISRHESELKLAVLSSLFEKVKQ